MKQLARSLPSNFSPELPMQYPLTLTFKLWSLAPQLALQDATGDNTVFCIRQKLFKLKEVINVFADLQRTQLKYEIKADRIIDFSARYNFVDTNGKTMGAVKRRGMKSLWRAHYDIYDGDTAIFTISEQNPWVKVMDSLFAEIPIVGLFTGYVFNPVYAVNRANGNPVMYLEKRPAFLSRIFTIKQVDQLSGNEEAQVLLSLVMMLLLERNRG
ncbi:hypothetical protein NDA01_19240 [Trichocoleus desertorum AS-A10]|uniref:hypothetical protein n=1 Tax=Trichocoleus desertorum TaxID=1481672 RepID=UPI00329E1B37